MTDYYISRDQECIVVELERTERVADSISTSVRTGEPTVVRTTFRTQVLGHETVTFTPTEWEAFVAEGNAIRDAIESGADDPDALGDLIRDGA